MIVKDFFKNLILILVCTLILFSCQKKSEITEVQESDKPSQSNMIFSLNIPKSYDDMYDTFINDYSISLYDLECISEGYTGLLYGIYAYEDPELWAGGPIEKVGELTLNNGKLYDIVIAYPTESQFGFNREMPENYKKLYDARYDILKTLKGINGEKFEYGKGVEGKGLYDSVLTQLSELIKEKADNDKLESSGFSSIYSMLYGDGNGKDTLKRIGYTYSDLNDDGIQELLITDITESKKQDTIFDIFTMVNRKPAHVISGWERNRFYSHENSLIVNEFSNSAFESGKFVYNLESNGTNLVYQLGIKYDSNEDNPYFLSYDNKGDDYFWFDSNETEYKQFDERFSNYVKFDFTELNKFK